MAHFYEDECVGCPKEMGCLGSACPNRNVLHCYCDQCGEDEEPEKLFIYESKNKKQELCANCYSELMLDEATKLSEILR